MSLNLKFVVAFLTMFTLTMSLTVIPSFKTNFIYAQSPDKSPNILMIGDTKK